MIRSVLAFLFIGLTSVFAQSAIQYYSTGSPAFYYSTPAPYPFVPFPQQYKAPLPLVEAPLPPAKLAPAPVIHKTFAQPAVPQLRSGVADKDASVIQEYRDVSFDGTFSYGFDSDNGLSVKSKGYLKPPTARNEEPIQVIEGSFSFIGKDGKPVTITYIADEEGFRAYGDAIPQPPDYLQKSAKSSRRK